MSLGHLIAGAVGGAVLFMLFTFLQPGRDCSHDCGACHGACAGRREKSE
ncbi:MAG: hypothetical protein AB7I33_00205 [Gemmatimonadales bacterium]